MAHSLTEKRAARPRTHMTASKPLPRWMILAIAIVGAFVVGMAWQYVRAARLSQRLDRAERAATLASLHVTLAAATLEAQAGRPEPARQLASDFFTRLQRAAAHLPADLRDSVRPLLARRDSTITLLSRGDAAASAMLRDLFWRFAAADRAFVDGDSTSIPIAPGTSSTR